MTQTLEDIAARMMASANSNEGMSWSTALKFAEEIAALQTPTNVKWVKAKPEPCECLWLTASLITPHHNVPYWHYNLFEITKIESDEGWYWGILSDGEEWGDIADQKSDLYCVVRSATSSPTQDETQQREKAWYEENHKGFKDETPSGEIPGKGWSDEDVRNMLTMVCGQYEGGFTDCGDFIDKVIADYSNRHLASLTPKGGKQVNKPIN